LEQFVGSVKISPSGELSEVQQQAREVASRIGHVVRELHQARSDAMRADRMAAVGELAAGVAHELRNPLTSLKLLIQAAAHRGRPLTERQLHVLQDEIVRMENTIRGLLDFTRAPQIRRVRHDVRDTVRRALNLVQARAKQTSVSIIEDLSAECVMVDGDPELLHQVFINLMLNALEAMSNGGTLRVFVGHAPGDSHMCLVEVSDSGPGIPQDLLARLFEPFVSGKEQGYGLGLAVSSRIVREHGGKLSACNRAEGGAVFTLELPACPAAAESPVAALMSTE
jgi:signal transduction histidine kinase